MPKTAKKKNDFICALKALPERLWIPAARRAIEINPANHPARHLLNLGLSTVIPPQFLALLTEKRWSADGVNLTVGFLDNPSTELKAKILSHMNAWGTYANVQFVETATDPQVRIARADSPPDLAGFWSFLGTDINHIDADKPTMNLDSFTINTPDAKFFRVVRHETGHTLGFPHEHLRDEIIERIDRDKAIEYFRENVGWTEAMVISNVLTPMDNSALIATAHADENSIMCYELPGSIMKDNVAIVGGADIDDQDAIFAASVYPLGRINEVAAFWRGMLGTFAGTFDTALNGGGPFSGKCYFFKGDRYVRYDWNTDRADSGYPKRIEDNWYNLPSGFKSDFDCAINGKGAFTGKCYFFKGDSYIRYDWSSDKMDSGYPKTIADNWNNLPNGFRGSFDAMINGGGSFSGKLYIFKDDQYIRYDWEADRVDPGYPRKISDNWPRLPHSFRTGLDAALEGDRGFSGKGYLFKEDFYVRYDWAADSADV